MDERHDPAAWADAFLDEHRTVPRPDREREREAAAAALKDLPRVTQRLLTLGGREPDLDLIERVKGDARRQAAFRKWDTAASVAGLVLVCVLAVISLSVL